MSQKEKRKQKTFITLQVREVQATDLLMCNYTARSLLPLDKDMENQALTTILKIKIDMIFMDHSDKILSKFKNYHFFWHRISGSRRWPTIHYVAKDGL